MTMPHLMNCDHSEEGWCLGCVKALWEKADALERALRRIANPVVHTRDDHNRKACDVCCALSDNPPFRPVG